MKNKNDSPDKKEIFNHIKESCINDPLYLTKIILGSVGKNAFAIVIRIAVYVLILYPILTQVIGVSNGVAGILILLGIILYHSVLSIYHKISGEVKSNGLGGSGRDSG